jgi:Glycosyl hydrolase catalytic core
VREDGAVRRLLPFVAALLLMAPVAARADPVVGVSDQSAAALQNPLFQWAGFPTARIIEPWNVALTPAKELDTWLDAAQADGLDVLVSFEHRRGEDCRVRACALPSPDELRAAFAAFLRRWPQVTAFGAWNEGNHPSQPTASDPAAAAGLYAALAAECPACRILAAEVVDIPGMTDWLRRFQAALPAPPQLWGLHNYGDVTRALTSGTDAMLATVPGEVWVTETGGLVRQLDANGNVRWPYDEERARAAVVNAFALADAHPDRITRLYFYQWEAGADEPWDSGLLRPDGSPRPSFTEVAARLHPAAPIPAPPPAAARNGGQPPFAAHGLRLLRRPRMGRDFVVRARVACARRAFRPCDARLLLRAHGSRRVLGRAARRVPRGAAATLAVRVPAARRRLIRLGRTTELLADVGAAATWWRRLVVPCRR